MTRPHDDDRARAAIGRVLSRRSFLDDAFTGLAGIGLAGLLADDLRRGGGVGRPAAG